MFCCKDDKPDDDKPDDDKHGSDKDDKKDDEKGDKKNDEKDDQKDDKKGDKKGDAPSLSLLLAMKSSDVGSCCYSKTGPSDCEHPGDWCSKTEAKCTDCGGTFWTAKQIDDFKHRKVRQAEPPAFILQMRHSEPAPRGSGRKEGRRQG